MRRTVSGRPGARGRAFPLAVAAVLALAVLSVVSSAGASRPAPTLGGVADDVGGGIKPLYWKGVTTVVVQLGDDPIAVADAKSKEAGSGALSRGRRDQIRQQLKQAQAPVAQAIARDGGKVLASYQAAYNGIRVRIDAKKTSELKSIPGVVAVHPVRLAYPSNVTGVPQIGAPQAWAGLSGVHGEGIKIADIDTGIDYTHADFGGPGTVAAFDQAAAASTLPANPLWFGPMAPRVKGGTDLVGDNYDPESDDPALSTPQPDPNPLDCNGHGTHTAGTAAGGGVVATPTGGASYTGPYTTDTVASHNWIVGPGVAPKADVYSVRVFGCNGATNVVVDAIEWAVENDMDVINMSLGSPFGSSTDPDAVAAQNAARDGVIVVSASGNDGHSPYMTSSPGAGPGTLSVAAEDPHQGFAGAKLALSTGTSLDAINANGVSPLPAGPYTVKVLKSGSSISLGCSQSDYGTLAPNTLVVTMRGTCARVARAIYGQNAGAAAVVMVNSTDDFPPFEGPITSNPDTGEPANVTIPFLGVRSSAAAALLAADGGTVTLSTATLANPAFAMAASFSSFGPDSTNLLKPQVTAPGVSIASAGVGTGYGSLIESGTSMATPHTTGAAALVRQAHPTWDRVQYWEAALENTADPGLLLDYSTVGEGAGLVQVQNAVKTDVVAIGGNGKDALGSLDFGLATFDRDYSDRARITLRNFGNHTATFRVADAVPQGPAHSILLDRPVVSVRPRGTATVDVRLVVPVSGVHGAMDPSTGSPNFDTVTGEVTFTPASAGDNNGVTLRVPYLLVPQALSHVGVSHVNLGHLRQGSVDVTLKNNRGAAAGIMDWFAWGLKDKRDPRSAGLDSDDLLNAGAAAYPGAPIGIFAVQTGQRWANPARDEFDVLVDVDRDGVFDYDVFAADHGAVTTGSFDGISAAFVLTLVGPRAGTISFAGFATTADFNGTTMEIPFLYSQLCRVTTPATPCYSATSGPVDYTVVGFGWNGTSDEFVDTATFDFFHPAVSSANFEDVVAPGASATDTVSIDKAQYQLAKPLGVMILSQNNLSHDNREEALTVPVPAGLVR